MPRYDYECSGCGTFEVFKRSYRVGDKTVKCKCGRIGRKVFTPIAVIGTTKGDYSNLEAPLGRKFKTSKEVDKFLNDNEIGRCS